ncbi:TIGR02444 family protein [Pseudoalteromonas sp. Of7M-16]|uniref:TIGR02444 family protein n=1 Tax=Pseudoalteromonas sp. Of7M-16 TaxID=2917756 RepID=UPI001EF60ACF|nr:TIGR02444 family protein [Pseudoalteromonas sp. Of7M-16]MCG7551423.1 TIGR02444 family protein [Pseudoalteromonas sp. Of7M-16]
MLSRDAFWQYACTIYQNEQVQQVLLECQDRYDKNVNLCLLLDYLSYLNVQLTEQQTCELEAVVKQIDRELLVPYRATRKQAKTRYHAYPDYQQLRASLLATELELEKLQQHHLIEHVKTFSLQDHVKDPNNLLHYLPKSLYTRFQHAKL